ncbi:TPA: thymidine phosphorylase, partial [Candidatus Bathyarchaeota archaeon]|nr:thymidine phosphorylase [Candidatus Bathyarchaeota archaeon]
MKLKAKILGLEAGGKSVVVLNKEDAEDLSVSSLERVRIVKDNKESIAIVNTATKLIEKGTIGLYEEVRTALGLEGGEEVEVEIA